MCSRTSVLTYLSQVRDLMSAKERCESLSHWLNSRCLFKQSWSFDQSSLFRCPSIIILEYTIPHFYVSFQALLEPTDGHTGFQTIFVSLRSFDHYRFRTSELIKQILLFRIFLSLRLSLRNTWVCILLSRLAVLRLSLSINHKISEYTIPNFYISFQVLLEAYLPTITPEWFHNDFTSLDVRSQSLIHSISGESSEIYQTNVLYRKFLSSRDSHFEAYAQGSNQSPHTRHFHDGGLAHRGSRAFCSWLDFCLRERGGRICKKDDGLVENKWGKGRREERSVLRREA